ncbi:MULTISPECIES: ATP-binding protein [Prauserella salsuginis group]|uniref:ATP-binding protein n=1 Tax=Prauserella salsuginis TaxID=387889 RepID=A0ABW6G6E4_9PSEU|nr:MULTISPECIES: ATP-binding protein [Prauserella salsuginis group]MCR3722839.1 AAA-like domain-containing protein [Prauserella flava]MCR3737106.1 AAA-like domain-containing protein [Prauserella salsuginis]
MFGRDRSGTSRNAAKPAPSTKTDGRGRRLPGEQAIPTYTPSIAARSIDGHLLRTGNEVYAWYRLAPQRWSFRSDSQRQDLIAAIAGQYAELQGRWMHLRVTTRPYPIRMWAEAHVHNAHDRPADVPGAPSFDDYLVGEQQQLMGRSMAEKEVYLGVQVQTRRVMDRAVERAAPLLRKILPEAVDAELSALDSEVEHLDGVIGSSGLEGRPVSADEMSWLMHRSCSLGLPAPRTMPAVPTSTWEPEDLASFTDAADFHADPYAPTVTVRGRTGSNAGVKRHVAVLTVGQMHGLQIPEVDDPWVQHADRLPAPVEWSARIYVRRPEEVAGELQRQMNKVRSQVKHYTDEHELEPPQSLARQASRVLEVDDEMTSGFTALATRVRSWWRMSVSGSSEREALKLAQQLLDLYKPKIAIEHPEAQYALAREFIPGEALASGAYLRRGSVVWAAASVPTATAEVGDRRGILLGETCTATRRPVAWDPWMAQEIRDGSGLTSIVAGLGGGKSFLGGGIVYKTLRAGAHWTILDPSGPLSRLCELPELRPYARPINLLNAQPGILNPYRVVAEPQLEHFMDEEDPERAWRRERALAGATRRRLVLDVLTGVLPYDVARMPQTRIVLLRAVRMVGGRHDADPGQVIDALRRDASEHHDHAVVVADFLDELRERMSLLIPEADADPYTDQRDDRLTVLTMAGLTLPKEGVGREHWTDAEALGVEMMNLAAWLTARSVYDKPKSARKGVWIDEAFFLSEVPTGRVLMNRFARDSRKWNVRVLLSSQIPADFLKIQGFVALLDSVFVGRLDDDEAQADALRLLKVPVGAGYEQVVSALGRRPGGQREAERDREPRQFIFGDGAGGVERIRVDFTGPHLQQLRDVLDTTPGGTPERPAQPPGADTQAVESRPADGGEADRTAERAPSRSAPTEPVPASPGREPEEDLELEAELEVGLTEDQLLSDTAFDEGGFDDSRFDEGGFDKDGVDEGGDTGADGGQEPARAGGRGKNGTGRDAA